MRSVAMERLLGATSTKESGMRQLIFAVVLGVVASACSDRQSITPPATAEHEVVHSASDKNGNLRSGGVFVATNQPSGNAIAAYYRGPDGTLTAAGMFPTGGLGAGGGPDPLRSQGSLILAAQTHDDE